MTRFLTTIIFGVLCFCIYLAFDYLVASVTGWRVDLRADRVAAVAAASGYFVGLGRNP